VGVAIVIFLTLGPVLAAQVPTPPTEQQQRLAEMKRLEHELAQMPATRPARIDQIVKFDLEGNMLALAAPLSMPADEPVHVVAPELRGYLRLTLRGPQDDPDLRGRNFSFVQHDMTDPQALVITHISAVAGQIIVARDGERGDVAWSIQLIQDPPPPAGEMLDQEAIRFLVRRDESPGRKEMNLKLSAANFVELRAKHGAELDAYFRPILRDFKQEGALFGVPSAMAWQVLGTGAQTDPRLLERINKIIARLDADDFQDRQKAAHDLKQLGQSAALAVSTLDRGKLTLTQISAVDSFLAEFAPLPAEKLAGLADDKGFLLDVLFSDDQALRDLASQRLSKVTGKTIKLSAEDSIARNEQIIKLRTELLPTTQPIADN
jgi:hypothetical protein